MQPPAGSLGCDLRGCLGGGPRWVGVHIIGEGASEILHIGQAVLILKGKVDYFIDTVFNYPTLAEAYKTAGLDAIKEIKGNKRQS